MQMTTTTTTAAVAVDDHGAYSRSNTRIEYTGHEGEDVGHQHHHCRLRNDATMPTTTTTAHRPSCSRRRIALRVPPPFGGEGMRATTKANDSPCARRTPSLSGGVEMREKGGRRGNGNATTEGVEGRGTISSVFVVHYHRSSLSCERGWTAL